MNTFAGVTSLTKNNNNYSASDRRRAVESHVLLCGASDWSDGFAPRRLACALTNKAFPDLKLALI